MARITIHPIIPKKMNLDAYRAAVTRALLEEGRTIQQEYEKISNGWDSPVQYDGKLIVNKLTAKITISTVDPRMVFLDLGTSHRWAVMSSDFKAKTRPGVIGSRRGAGQVVIRGQVAMETRGIKARPGIKAREFSITIAKRREKPFERKVQNEITLASKNTF